MDRKSIWVVVGIIVMVLIVFVLISLTSKNPIDNNSYKIGVILPLSGPASYYGEQTKKGIEFADSYLIKTYPDIKFSIIYGDSQYDPRVGVNAYAQLQETNKLDAVITLASPISLAIQPLAKKDGILQMAVASTASKYSTPNDLSFRTIPIVKKQTDLLAKYIFNKKYSRVGILYVKNDFGIGGKDAFKNSLQDQGLINKIVSEESFLTDATDFRTQLTKIKADDPDVVFIIGTAANYSNLLRQKSELGLKSQFVSISSTEDSSLLANASQYAEGIIYTYYFIDFAMASQLQDGYAAEGYEAVRLVGLAFSECGKDYSCIQQYLSSLRGYDSVFGELSFDINGDVDYPFILKTIKNGQFIKL
jgi:branched-chain amino acid transport system substrate-binding protein